MLLLMLPSSSTAIVLPKISSSSSLPTLHPSSASSTTSSSLQQQPPSSPSSLASPSILLPPAPLPQQQQQHHYQQQEEEENNQELLLLHHLRNQQESSEQQLNEGGVITHHHHHHRGDRRKQHSSQHPSALDETNSALRLKFLDKYGHQLKDLRRRQFIKQRRLLLKKPIYSTLKSSSIADKRYSRKEKHRLESSSNTANVASDHFIHKNRFRQPFDYSSGGNERPQYLISGLTESSKTYINSDENENSWPNLKIVIKPSKDSTNREISKDVAPLNDPSERYEKKINESSSVNQITFNLTKNYSRKKMVSCRPLCSVPADPPQCCGCGSIPDIVDNLTTTDHTISTDIGVLGGDECDILGSPNGNELPACQRQRDGNCCSSVMSLANLTDMVGRLEEQKVEENQSNMDSGVKTVEDSQPRMEKGQFLIPQAKCMPKQCLHIRNNTCSQNNIDIGKESKRECLTHNSFLNEDDVSCCRIDHEELFQFSLQHCRKYPIMRVLWPKAFVRSRDECASTSFNELYRRRSGGGVGGDINEEGKKSLKLESDDVFSDDATRNVTESISVSQSALRHLVERDSHIGRVIAQHNKILQRMDRQDRFSCVNCSEKCQVRWI